MKKTKRLAVLILLVCTLAGSPAQAISGAIQLAQINQNAATDLTYLRIEPRDDADSTFGYYKGAFLMILSEDTNGWCLVSIGNQQGYVKKDEIMAADAFSSTATLPVILAKPESPTGWVNLRQLPSLEAEGLQRLAMNEQAILLGITNDWYHVMIGDTLGYIKAEFTAFSDSYIERKSGDLKVSLYDGGAQPLSTVLTGNKRAVQQSAMGTTQTASETKRSYQMSMYTETPNPGGSIKVQYPIFGGNGADALNAIVNKKVQSLVQSYKSYMIEEFALSVDLKAAVTLHNNKMASTVFWGESNLGSADGIGKPYTDLFVLNVDLSSMREITFPELFEVDQGLEEVFLTKSIFPSNPITSYNASLFHEMRTYQTREYRSSGPFSPIDSVQCFFKPEGVVISVGAVHATGSDHFEAQLRYDDIQQYYLPTQKYWED